MTKAVWQNMVAKYGKEAHFFILFAERMCDLRVPGYGTKARNTIPLLTKEARTRFVNDPIDIGRERERGVATKGAPGRLPCVDPAPTGPSGKRLSMNGQRCPRRVAGSYQWPQGRPGNTNATTRGPVGAYIPCGLTAARREIGAAYQGPGGQVST